MLSSSGQSKDAEEDGDEDEGTETAAPPARPVPVQPVSTAPAAGTDVFEMRRRKRVERLKFRWLRQQLSGKVRGARRRTRTASSTDEDVPLRGDSVLDDDVAMTTASGAAPAAAAESSSLRPWSRHVITPTSLTY